MKNSISVYILFLLIIGCFACSKNELADIRDQSEGIYVYTVDYYTIAAGGNLVKLPERTEKGGNMTVKKNLNDAQRVDFIEDGDVVFSGSKIIADKTGFKFDIPSQTLFLGGNSISVSSYDRYNVETTAYNAVYYSTEQKIEIAFLTMLSGVQFVMIATLTLR
jgi:hypothetical protein